MPRGIRKNVITKEVFPTSKDSTFSVRKIEIITQFRMVLISGKLLISFSLVFIPERRIVGI